MSETLFHIPRQSDQRIIEALKEIGKKAALSGPVLYVHPFDGCSSKTVSFESYGEDQDLKDVLPLRQSTLLRLSLNFKPNNQEFTAVGVTRVHKAVFDECRVNWNEKRDSLSESAYMRLVAFAKSELKEIKVDEGLAVGTGGQTNSFIEASVAAVGRLQSLNEELLYGVHDRQKRVDEDYRKKVAELEAGFDLKKQELQTQFDQKQRDLDEREAVFKKKQEQFETSESKYLRRQLSKDMLKILESFKTKFELTKSTRSLRLPITIFSVILLALFGTLMVLGFYQTFELLKGQELSKINTIQILVLTLKQLGFTAAFIATAYFFIKWSDRWFRQHADTEFMFKRLELDITRASWVVEMAMEWKAEKGTEIPSELLNRLTLNLFREVGSGDGDAPPNVADVILGSAATVKFKTPGGTEVDIDRKGLQKALAQGSAK